jgi:hypothetical protein
VPLLGGNDEATSAPASAKTLSVKQHRLHTRDASIGRAARRPGKQELYRIFEFCPGYPERFSREG